MGSVKSKSITVDMNQSTPGIVNNCVLIGLSFLSLDKISYICEIYEYYDNSYGYIKAFELVCDGILFKIKWNYRGSFESEDTNKNKVETFQKFHSNLIDMVFDKNTKRNYNKSYI